jgi:hypothetical protein
MPTTVRDLIEELNQMPPDALVVQSADAEGNDFSPFLAVSREQYVPDTPWRGRLADGLPNAVVLWPGG